MNDDDDKTDARGGAEPQSAGPEDRWKSGRGSSGSRNTAPAGTPVHKATAAALPLGAPIKPDQLGPPPIVTSTSDRPPTGETMTQTRTVGGHTARLKVPEDEEPARTRGRRPPPNARRSPEEEDEANARSGAASASARGAGRDGRAAALRAKDGGASWEAEVKFSDPPHDGATSGAKPRSPAGQELPARKAPAPAAPAAAESGQLAESRWPFAIALGAVAFAIGSLLPLPFRKHIVGSIGESTAAQMPSIPLSVSARGASPAPPTAAPTGAPAPSAAAPAVTSAAPVEAASAKPGATTATTATAAPSGAVDAGKRPTGKVSKPGHLGDIF